MADVDFTLENPCFATPASFDHAFKKESNLRVEYQKIFPGNNSSFHDFPGMIARLPISRRKITGCLAAISLAERASIRMAAQCQG